MPYLCVRERDFLYSQIFDLREKNMLRHLRMTFFFSLQYFRTIKIVISTHRRISTGVACDVTSKKNRFKKSQQHYSYFSFCQSESRKSNQV